MKKCRSALLVAIAVLIGACNPGEDSLAQPGVEQQRAAIVGGPVESGYASVGALSKASADGALQLCTGTVVAEHWVLTAAQCVDGVAPADLTFVTGADVENPVARYPVVQTFVHRSYDAAYYSNDIALVYVDGLTDVTEAPYNCYALSGSTVGTSVMKVGYGSSSAALVDSQGIKRIAALRIDSVAMTTLSYEYLGQGPCFGDEGGPSFLDTDGEERVVGVTSSFTESCDGASVDTRVDPYCSWIDATQRDGAPDVCSVFAGDCGAGTCVPVSEDAAYCMESAGHAEGESCDASDADWSDGLPCADGLWCVEGESGGACRLFCTSDSDCEANDVCVRSVPGIDGVGVCQPCTDADGDGYCADVDCADDNAGVNPGASEDCFDGIDNDCDGDIDDDDTECAGGDDAGVSDAGDDAGSADNDATSSVGDTGGGCGCTTSSPTVPLSPALVFLVIVAAAQRSSRRRERASFGTRPPTSQTSESTRKG